MLNYRRAEQAGGTLFLTLVTHGRMRLFDHPAARRCLHEAMAVVRRDHPFELVAIVLLPDHVHLIITLPEGDADFSVRVAGIKAGFTRRWLATGGAEGMQSASAGGMLIRAPWHPANHQPRHVSATTWYSSS